MNRSLINITEALALFGLLCCIFVLHANLWFLSAFIAFALCEVLLELVNRTLKKPVATFYHIIFFLIFLSTSIYGNGLQLISFLPLFFWMTIVVISKYKDTFDNDQEEIYVK
ncbi:hypothetical protein MUG87_16205 [Ectobacillus sp. JY-23]|uniref:hypothetical protein n=1 Tax=Ectobacillus sp. JY-23 TaxID=2933872 RepID=UPI001FF28792|nr:hypothetical protein [Ectobacillus sp. JY-23]UOY91970.1 hypothetical protein MUG87_16205 [Ectobacillus sp. JY-23]